VTNGIQDRLDAAWLEGYEYALTQVLRGWDYLNLGVITEQEFLDAINFNKGIASDG
jgi:hypothetical protein